jgi:chromate transporter
MAGDLGTQFAQNWREISLIFLRLGATAYGGPAIMGVMQAELQEKRQWVSKDQFLEGLSLVNLVPGATATQLGIFLGHARGGWRGSVLAGLCFVAPAFCVMIVLATAYAALGATPLMRGGLYGLGPVVLGIFVVAVYRLGRVALTSRTQLMLSIVAAAAVAFSPLGAAAVLALAIGVGILLFQSRRVGALVIASLAGALAAIQFVPWALFIAVVPAGQAAAPVSLGEIAAFFLGVGAFTFGGGITMVALMQEQLVSHLHWLTQQEFIDGLALGQFTPGPILMVAAYVGYKVGGVAGAAVAAAAVFLPSFVLMLVSLPLLERVRPLAWTKAAMRAVGPAVIGVMVVSLVQLGPHALPDLFTAAIFVGAVTALQFWRIGAMKLMGTGAVLGALRTRFAA